MHSLMLPFSNQCMPMFPVCPSLWRFFPSCLCAHGCQKGCVIWKTCHVLCRAFIASPPLLCQPDFPSNLTNCSNTFPGCLAHIFHLFLWLIWKLPPLAPLFHWKTKSIGYLIGLSLSLGESWGNSGKKAKAFHLFIHQHGNQWDFWA